MSLSQSGNSSVTLSHTWVRPATPDVDVKCGWSLISPRIGRQFSLGAKDNRLSWSVWILCHFKERNVKQSRLGWEILLQLLAHCPPWKCIFPMILCNFESGVHLSEDARIIYHGSSITILRQLFVSAFLGQNHTILSFSPRLSFKATEIYFMTL